jgi:hypothetical protein
MLLRIAVSLFACGTCCAAFAQAIAPDRQVVPGYVYSYEKDGVRHFSSKQPTLGAYRAIPYSLISTIGPWRINGLPCESTCDEEAQGYRSAKAAGVVDATDCPREPDLEARGCKLWVMEQRDKAASE